MLLRVVSVGELFLIANAMVKVCNRATENHTAQKVEINFNKYGRPFLVSASDNYPVDSDA